MWPKCRELGVAAITYEPIEKIDLSKHRSGEPRRLWKKLAPAQSASLSRVAYEMKAGDVIFVKEGRQIVGKGIVTGSYTFDAKFRIVDPNGYVWPHQVPVDWEVGFPEVDLLLGAELFAVKPLSKANAEKILGLAAANKGKRPSFAARVCWNTNNWLCPSGDAKRIESGDNYAAQMGFGHEEWLFNFNWMLDGYKYAFLQPVNKSIARVEGRIINAKIFSVAAQNRWLYVGEIGECEILTQEQSRFALDKFKSRGWLSEMEAQVKAVGGNIAGLRGKDPRSIFNIRFLAENATLYDPPVPVPDGDSIRRLKRYSLVSTKDIKDLDEQWNSRVASTKARPTGKIGRKGVEPTEFDLLHNAIQNTIAEILRRRFGKGSVTMEEGFVDLKVVDAKRLLFIEVKADSRPRYAIRAALGQLLEYNFVAIERGETPTEFLVVGPGILSKQDKKYIEHLGQRWSIPIRYVSFSVDSEKLEV